MIYGTLYLSLFAFMNEITRYFKSKSDLSGKPITLITKWIHRLLKGCSVFCVISYIPYFLILCSALDGRCDGLNGRYDGLNGGGANTHVICCGAIVVLYIALGINAVIHRKKTSSES